MTQQPLFPAPEEEFTDKERQLIKELSFRLTGASPASQPKIESCLVNIKRRMVETGCSNLHAYLAHVEASTDEFSHFISAITIHTTSWFREMPHYDKLRQHVMGELESRSLGKKGEPFFVLSAGCSSGEEAYSIALVLEDLRQKFPGFDYRVEGWDIDPVSVARAKQAIYPVHVRQEIPAPLHKFLLIGSGKTQGFLTLDKEIRSRCSFRRRSLVGSKTKEEGSYHLIFCRNVLIYFSPDSVKEIIRSLVGFLFSKGQIYLGHSESIEAKNFNLVALGHATYKRSSGEVSSLSAVSEAMPTRSTSPPNLTVVSSAPTSSLARPHLILIGASTGGTEVLINLLQNMPKPCPPVAVVQHIAVAFGAAFAERLARSSGLTLATPSAGMTLLENHLYMALDDYHIGVKQRGASLVLELSRDPPIHSVRPSVDYLFQTAAKTAHAASMLAIILTGMGKDGASGMADLHTAGARTLVQDEESSTVFGMPKEAIMRGAATFIGNPDQIRQQIFQALKNEYP